jgi:chitodextrinase
MATLALSLAGQFVGGAVGGPLGATIGRALGALAGSAVDNVLFGEKPEPRVGADVRVTGSSEGGAVPRLYGWARLAGNIVWATELEELTDETAGAKGFGGGEGEDGALVASFAVAFCEGEVSRLGRVWADGHVLETSGLTLRFYRGSEEQEADSLIEATQGTAPGYRGVCYLVFERLPLAPFGNRIPSISAELCRPVGELEPLIRAINVIPGAGEYCYDPVARVRLVSPGVTAAENTHLSAEVSDWTLSIDELQALCPNLEHVGLVVAWFGDDLRAAHCTIAPRVEGTDRVIEGEAWAVAGFTRGTAAVVSAHAGGPAYGGTPSDAAVLRAIADLHARGLGVTLYPLVMMDISAGNELPNPYGGTGQPAYPWRGRITCDPAPGMGGSPDGTATAAAQVAAFAETYREMVLHYAALAEAAGGVDAIVIGSEMRGLTFVRGEDDTFPFVEALVELAGDVRAVVGGTTKLTYAADWSEATGYQPGGGAKFFHLDPLWAVLDAVGIDNYMPAADWRDGDAHLDAADWDGPYEVEYLRAGITGGEGYDWYYGSDADRAAQVRAPITDGAHGEHWVWRFKDLAGWWGNAHHDRPGGVRSGTPTAWTPGMKPIWFTEIGCGAVDKGANQPSAFGDAKSAEDARPYFSSGAPDALMQRQFLRAHLAHWNDGDANPAGMVDPARIYPWAWDARPFPAFPQDTEAWGDGENHATGHWLTGRLGAAASDEVLAAMAADFGVDIAGADANGPLIQGAVIDVVSARDAMAPVLAAAGLSVRDGAGGLAFGRVSVRDALPVTADAVAAGDGARVDGPLSARRRPDPGEEVGTLAVGYVDRERNYLAGTVTAMKLSGGVAAGENAGLVLDVAGARRVAERLLLDAAAGRDTLEFALPPSMAALEVGDAVALEGQGDGPFEVTAIRDGEVRRISARAIPPVVEAAIVADAPRTMGSPAATLRAVPLVVAAHLPPVAGKSETSRLLLAAWASPWPGFVEVVEATTGAAVARLERGASVGELVEALAAGPTAAWDRGNALVVQLHAGHLAPVDDEAALAGANRVAVETAGGWEIVGFAAAELLSPGVYRLTRLLRGLDGTDAAMGPAAAGNRVVVLDGRVRFADVSAAWLGGSVELTAFAGAADATGAEVAAELGLDPLLPLAPVHLRAARSGGSNDVALGWVRRSRADTNSWTAADAPLEHVPEAYRVTIFDGADAVRTIDAGGPAATYTAAEQAADFGAPPPGFAWSVAQLSPAYGPGHAAAADF